MATAPLLAATLLSASASGATVLSTVYTHGEDGFPCIRIPSTLALPFDVMLSFAAARSWTGDVRQPICPARPPPPHHHPPT